MANDEEHTGELIQIKKREDVCPTKNAAQLDPRCSARRNRPRSAPKDRPGILAQPRRTRGQRRIPGSPAPRISQRRFRVDRHCLPPRIPQSHGRFARPGRHDRMRQAPLEAIVPYVRQPENVIPGRPMYYATAHHARRICQSGSRRKPSRPPHEDRRQRSASASLGGTDIFAQASILGDVRSRPLAERGVHGRSALVRGIPQRDSRTAQRAKSTARRGHPHSDARRFLRPRSPTRSAIC